MDKIKTANFLIKLESLGLLDSRLNFVRKNNELVLLSGGGNNYVYEMEDSSGKKYAAKIVSLGLKKERYREIEEAVKVQDLLSKKSPNIQKVVAIITLAASFNEMLELLFAERIHTDKIEDYDGTIIQIIITEELRKIKYVDNNERLKSEDEIVEFAKQIGNALLVVHDNNYMHRDIKPDNILWDDENKIYKLSDFDNAAYIIDKRLTKYVGTKGYMAPEIWKHEKSGYDKTADIYSLGCTLGKLVRGKRISRELERLIAKMKKIDNKDRYQSIDEVLKELDKIEKAPKIDSVAAEENDIGNVTITEITVDETMTYRTTMVEN